MDIIKMVSLAIVCMLLITMLKNTRPEYALLVEIMGGITLFLMILGKVITVFGLMETLTLRIKFDPLYFKILMKVVGIAYIAEFGMSLCRDAGLSAMAAKVELGAKILILMVALPVLNILLEKIALIMR